MTHSETHMAAPRPRMTQTDMRMPQAKPRTTQTSTMMPGLEAIQTRFVSLLEERHAKIAQHALDAWDGETLEAINGNLAAAQATLHQIAGSAGSLGFAELGQSARDCEAEIIAHLEGPDADLAICPGELMYHLDIFVSDCRKLITSFN